MAQTDLGKAFEYACLKALYDHHSDFQLVEVVQNEPYNTALRFYADCLEKQNDLMAGAKAAVRVLNRLEPRLTYYKNNVSLVLSLQADAAGQSGDVRDVLCLRQADGWQIGLSCKHNHEAVKHSRLSNTIDFGQKWLGVPCSKTYFSEIKPYFDRLDYLRAEGRRRNRPYKFEDFDSVEDEFYVPILNAFMKELQRIADENEGVPARLVHYLMGEYDFYKIITDDRHRLTKVEAVNINGTLNKSFGGHKAITTVPAMKLPTEFFVIRWKRNSKNTIEVVCDNAWTFTMRIHSAKKTVEPSLKFDINLSGTPGGFYLEMEPWDK